MRRWTTSGLFALGAAAGGAASLGSPWLASAFLVAVGVVAASGRTRTVADRWDAVDDGATDGARGSWAPASADSVGRQLGWFEARELLRSGWFAAGFGMCILAVVTADTESSLGSVSEQLLILSHPLVAMAVVASHRAATRAERDNTSELFDVCATDTRRRAVGVMWSAWVPAATLATFFAGFVVVVVGWGPSSVSADAGATAANLAAGLVLGVGGVALGVALAQRTRSALAPLIALIAIGFASARLGDVMAGSFEYRMLLSTLGPVGDMGRIEVHFTTSQAVAHLAVMVLLTSATIAVAVAPSRR